MARSLASQRRVLPDPEAVAATSELRLARADAVLVSLVFDDGLVDTLPAEPQTGW